MELAKAIMYLLVGVSVLLVGMKFMSGGLKKIAGHGLRNFFRKTQNNPVAGMGIGTAVTVVIQSSDATAALVIGFINAGVMTIYQGLTIILGAYIGTTITGVLASFSSLSISVYLLAFAFVGTAMTFFSDERVKTIGEILTGFGLLFFGLAVMKDAFAQADIQSFCKSMFTEISAPPLLFIIGVILAAIAQSSSAVTGIVIAMVGGGALPLQSALFLVLGATLGTVTNTLLAASGGNVDGKRTAAIAFALRAMTSIVAMVILWIFINPISEGLHHLAIGEPDPLTGQRPDEFPVAMFTVIYNIIFMPLMLPLLKPMIRLFSSLITDKKEKNIANCVQFIDDNLLKSPDIALMQVRKEIVHMFDLSYENYRRGLDKILVYSSENTKLINGVEDQIDYLNHRITDFLIKLANVVGAKDEKKVGSYFHVINDIERIGDHAVNFSETADTLHAEELAFSPAAATEIRQMDAVLCSMFDSAKEIFVNKDRGALKNLHRQEEETDHIKKNSYGAHYQRVIRGECTQAMTPYISTLMVELERIADHLTNIGYSIVNPTGSENKIL